MLFNFYFSVVMVLFSLFMLSWFFKHLLLTIIILEFVMLSVLMNLFIYYSSIFKLEVLIYFLSVGVCEGALALSLLVMVIRSYGNDYMNSLSLLKW